MLSNFVGNPWRDNVSIAMMGKNIQSQGNELWSKNQETRWFGLVMRKFE